MNKFNEIISEINCINERANSDQWMNRFHPLVKLFITIVYIGIVVSFQKYDLLGLFSMFVYPVVIFILAELSWKEALYRLRMILPLVMIVGLFNPIFDTRPCVFAGIKMTMGVLSMMSLLLKGVLSVLASYIFVVSTSIESLCSALTMIHVPKMVVMQIQLSYRYLTVLLEEAKRITLAYHLRAPGQKGIHFKAWGSLVGGLLIRSMDRGDRIYDSMVIRGFTGEAMLKENVSWKVRDVFFCLIWMLLFILFRVLPIFEIVGGLFVS